MGLTHELFGVPFETLTIVQKRIYQKEWRLRNRDRLAVKLAETRDVRNQKRRERFASDPEYRDRQRAMERAWVKAHPRNEAGYYRRYRLKTEYGLTSADYERMLANQGGRCALCRCHQPGRKQKHWQIDHDHKSGRIRALLCHNCNMLLGHSKDNPTLLRKAANFIEEHRHAETQARQRRGIQPILAQVSETGSPAGCVESVEEIEPVAANA